MPVISSKVVKKPWTPKKCDFCGKQMALYKPRIRCFGYAFKDSPKYTIYICMDCARKSINEKVKHTLLEFENKQKGKYGVFNIR